MKRREESNEHYFFSLFLLMIKFLSSFSLIVHLNFFAGHHLWLKQDRWISTYLLLNFAHVMKCKKNWKDVYLSSFGQSVYRQVSISLIILMIVASETRRLSCCKSSTDKMTSRILLLNNDSSTQSIYIINIDFLDRIR